MKNFRKIHEAFVADRAKKFAKDEKGGITVLSLYLGLTTLIVGGLAVDVASLMSTRTQMQVATDYAAHAALYNREVMNADDAKATAVQLVQNNLYSGLVAVTAEDIHFGTYNFATSTFTSDPDSTEAVLVETSRLADRANPVSSYLLKLVGLNTFDLRTRAVFETYRPGCLREGFVADGIVDIQSNNAFFNGFCIHSNRYVSLNSGNFFQDGVSITMPRVSDLDAPDSAFEQNDGLREALGPDGYNIRILDEARIERELLALTVEGTENYRDWLVNETVVPVSGKNFDTTDFPPGHIYELSCNGNKGIINASSSPLTEVVIRTDCELMLSNNSELQDVVIYNTNTSVRSINSSQGLVLGRPDNCNIGGGVQIITLGGFNVAATLEMHGAQIIAAGNIDFEANANGLNGVSLIAGGEIDTTSNIQMSLCGTGMEDNFEVDYFRMRG